MQAAQLQGLRHTLQGLHHGQVSGNNAASSAIRLTLFSLRVYHYKGGGGEPITKARNRSIPLPLRFVSPPISFLRPFALTLYTRVHARTTITRRDNDDPDRADNRLFARPRFLCILLRGERERKLRSSRVLITPGVASGQHFIFALPATFLIPVATGRPKNILIAPSPLNTFYARYTLPPFFSTHRRISSSLVCPNRIRSLESSPVPEWREKEAATEKARVPLYLELSTGLRANRCPFHGSFSE